MHFRKIRQTKVRAEMILDVLENAGEPEMGGQMQCDHVLEFGNGLNYPTQQAASQAQNARNPK